MNLIYNVDDKVPFKKNIVFAIQQLLAIIAATLLVPTLVNLTYGEEILNQAAALFGAGVWAGRRWPEGRAAEPPEAAETVTGSTAVGLIKRNTRPER